MPGKNKNISNVEMINVIRATIEHNTQRANQQINLATSEKAKLLVKAGFDEVLDGHFNLLKLFVFIEMVESNKLNLDHLEDLIAEHLKIINEQMDVKKVINEKEKSKIEYNKLLWETVREKMNAYMALINPVE